MQKNNLGLHLEQFQHNLNPLLIQESYAPIKRLAIKNNSFSFKRAHYKTTLFVDHEQNVEHILIEFKLINSRLIYFLPATIAASILELQLQHEALVKVMKLLMDLPSNPLTMVNSVVIQNTQYFASWDAEQNYNLNIYPFYKTSDHTSS